MSYKINVYKEIIQFNMMDYVTGRGTPKHLTASRRGYLVNRANEMLENAIKKDAPEKDVIRIGCYIKILLNSTKHPFDMDLVRKNLGIDELVHLYGKNDNE